MQKENGTGNDDPNMSTGSLSGKLPNNTDFTNLYSSIFPQQEFLANSESICLTPSSCSGDEQNAVATENRLYLARLALQYQQMIERYGVRLTHLRQKEQEAETLRQENADLRNEIGDLSTRLRLMSVCKKQSRSQSRVASQGFKPLSVINDFRQFCSGDSGRKDRLPPELPETSPTSVLGFEENRFQGRDTERVTLPKSISIRSSGFLKVGNPSGGKATSSSANRLKVATPVTVEGQRVYVPGGKKEEEPLEFEVFNQGMFKTELCNKWQETGACPYGDHCQFAHGIGELRPVIRHPRYKTEVCRMVLAGDICPYGHRCHFRHALTEQERLVGPA